MAREAVWYTVVAGIGNAATWTVEMVDVPGTVQRLVGQINGQHASAGVGQFASFHWIINVGAAAANPNTFGLDAETTMLHGAALIPNTSAGALATTAPQLSFDSEGQRVIGAGESLWLRVDAGLPATDWGWTCSIRVLVLLPEA